MLWRNYTRKIETKKAVDRQLTKKPRALLPEASIVTVLEYVAANGRDTKDKDQEVQKTRGTKSQVSTYEASRRAVGDPVMAEPAPAHHNTDTVVIDVRNEEAAIAVANDRLPAEHCPTSEEFSENDDALLLNLHCAVKAETCFQTIGCLQKSVDDSAHRSPFDYLGVVEPEIDSFGKVVLGRPNSLQFGVHHLRCPAWVGRTDGAIDTDDGVERSFLLRNRSGFWLAEGQSKSPLETTGVVDPALHDVSIHVRKILGDPANQLCSLLVHGAFPFLKAFASFDFARGHTTLVVIARKCRTIKVFISIFWL